MSDFSQVCPLFTAGVFNEITFPYILMTDISNSGNALIGTQVSVSHLGVFTFGRTVIVTGAWIRRSVSAFITATAQLTYATSQRATPSSIGTVCVPTSGTKVEFATWSYMSVTAHTFTSNDVLGLNLVTSSNQSAPIFDLIVRYKEK